MTAATVRLVDVGPRDGLQNAPVTLEPAMRTQLAMRLRATGLCQTEVASFVHPARVPQMAGAEEVVAGLDEPESSAWCGLALNERGLDRLMVSGLQQARFTFAVSDEFNRRNANASLDEGLEAACRVIHRAHHMGLRIGVVLATAFGCPFSGEVDPGLVTALAAALADAGADEVVLADTIGVAVPRQLRDVLRRCAGLPVTLGVHLHNTRNTGYLNAYIGLEEGARIIDASVGGLGGCPFAPNATGNVATEDLVYLLEREGIETGVDLDALIEVANWLSATLGLALDGALHRVDRFPPARRTGLT